MCGRYVIALRPSQVRHRLADQRMPADDAPDDDDEQLRQSYNFAPGYHGLIYRAATSDRGTDSTPYEPGGSHDEGDDDQEPSPKKAKLNHPSSSLTSNVDGHATTETKYKLQAAKWGLIPFWTKRPPDYGSMMRTINCRDDSLIENRGMWNTMKQRKRCIVVAEGFYEWLKKNGGKEKVPHFVKRKDGQLMCFAGLWDCVKYEGAEESDKLYTYTIITTDSNRQLKFLHDRMPVILESGSEAMKMWLDPHNVGWNKELQGILNPFDGELECYQVDKAVGKVGNNSPSFVVPIDSKENKKNIANFFGTQKAKAGEIAAKNAAARKDEENADVEKDESEYRETTTKIEDPESNAPLPKPPDESEEDLSQAIKREGIDDATLADAADEQVEKGIKRELSDIRDEELLAAENSPPRKMVKPAQTTPSPSPAKKATPSKARSATTNNTVAKTPTKEKNAKITSFFGGKT